MMLTAVIVVIVAAVIAAVIVAALLNNKEIYTGTADDTHKCSTWWLSTHQRVQQHYPDDLKTP